MNNFESLYESNLIATMTLLLHSYTFGNSIIKISNSLTGFNISLLKK